MKTTRIIFTIPQELKRRLRECAGGEDKSLSEKIRELLAQAVDYELKNKEGKV